ncbi:MAG: peptidoglycan-binding protein LysM [Moraxellaceae bacterium]|nr:peptidoglycan-binding protein LysM [Moraxellaceae bacterium]
MATYDFAKDSGEDVFDGGEELTTQEIANLLLKTVQDLGLEIDGLGVKYNASEDKAEVHGTANSQEDKEKVILALGNVKYVAHVEDNLEVEASEEPESQLYEVKAGDTLSQIAKDFYGEPDYMKIFEANKPLLKDPNKIYVGQKLRIPA